MLSEVAPDGTTILDDFIESTCAMRVRVLFIVAERAIAPLLFLSPLAGQWGVARAAEQITRFSMPLSDYVHRLVECVIDTRRDDKTIVSTLIDAEMKWPMQIIEMIMLYACISFAAGDAAIRGQPYHAIPGAVHYDAVTELKRRYPKRTDLFAL